MDRKINQGMHNNKIFDLAQDTVCFDASIEHPFSVVYIRK